MGKSISDYLIDDHQEVLELLNKTVEVCERELGKLEGGRSSRTRQLYEEFTGLMLAHSKSEERVVYHRFDDADLAGSNEELRDLTLQAEVQHMLAQGLMMELDQTEINERWKAKLIVLKELIETHIDEEERILIPQIESRLGKEELVDLGAIFASEKEAFLSNDSGKVASQRRGSRESSSEAFH